MSNQEIAKIAKIVEKLREERELLLNERRELWERETNPKMRHPTSDSCRAWQAEKYTRMAQIEADLDRVETVLSSFESEEREEE